MVMTSDYISNHGKFPEKEAKIKFSQILEAVEYCHNLGIVHRDLKVGGLAIATFNPSNSPARSPHHHFYPMWNLVC